MWLNNLEKPAARALFKPLLFNTNFFKEFSVDRRKPVGISAGFVSLDRNYDKTASDLIERADILMYRRKKIKNAAKPVSRCSVVSDNRAMSLRCEQL